MNGNHRWVPSVDAILLARASGYFGHILLKEGDESHPVMIVLS
jgi:hypothetical protein